MLRPTYLEGFVPILADDKQDIPVTITVKAETAMQIAVWMAAAAQIPAGEMVKVKEAITAALAI